MLLKCFIFLAVLLVQFDSSFCRARYCTKPTSLNNFQFLIQKAFDNLSRKLINCSIGSYKNCLERCIEVDKKSVLK